MQREQELSAANTAAMLEIQRMAEEAERMKRLIEHGKADGEQLRQRIVRLRRSSISSGAT
jgi:hypothetical protein